MQAIHMAALAGHSAIVNTLVNEYHVDPNVPVSFCLYNVKVSITLFKYRTTRNFSPYIMLLIMVVFKFLLT